MKPCCQPEGKCVLRPGDGNIIPWIGMESRESQLHDTHFTETVLIVVVLEGLRRSSRREWSASDNWGLKTLLCCQGKCVLRPMVISFRDTWELQLHDARFTRDQTAAAAGIRWAEGLRRGPRRERTAGEGLGLKTLLCCQGKVRSPPDGNIIPRN